MGNYRKPIILAVLLTILTISAAAQTPVISAGAIFNAASYAYPGLPDSGIAPGSMFTVFLSTAYPNLPSAGLTQFPLPTVFPSSANGVSMTVTVGGDSVDTYVYFTAQVASGTQIGGILPSSTPVGAGMLTVTVNGQTSAPQPINVVASAFGTFTRNESGTGAGVFTDGNGVAFTPVHAALANDLAVGWGTGLGGITGDETSGVRPGAVPPVVSAPGSINILVGGLPATFVYGGRSSGGAGEDQINFVVPAGVTGCAVPVVFEVNGLPSSFTTMPIAVSSTRVCSDANGFSASDLQTLITQKSLKIGAIELSHVQYTYSTSPGLPSNSSVTDTGFATFGTLTTGIINAFPNLTQLPSPGTCTVNQLRFGNMGLAPLQISGTPLDAGAAISVFGPNGTTSITKVPITLDYAGTFSTGYLSAGNYALTNANGGTNVKALQFAMTIAAPLTWTNAASISVVNRANGLPITWTGGDPAGLAVIEGYSAFGTPSTGALFTCVAPIGAGQFTVPASVLGALPASSSVAQNPSILMVGTTGAPVKFTAPGLDLGYLYATSVAGQSVIFQ